MIAVILLLVALTKIGNAVVTAIPVDVVNILYWPSPVDEQPRKPMRPIQLSVYPNHNVWVVRALTSYRPRDMPSQIASAHTRMAIHTPTHNAGLRVVI